jgi:hypothetical protein
VIFRNIRLCFFSTISQNHAYRHPRQTAQTALTATIVRLTDRTGIKAASVCCHVVEIILDATRVTQISKLEELVMYASLMSIMTMASRRTSFALLGCVVKGIDGKLRRFFVECFICRFVATNPAYKDPPCAVHVLLSQSCRALLLYWHYQPNNKYPLMTTHSTTSSSRWVGTSTY